MEQPEIKINVVKASTFIVEDILDYFNVLPKNKKHYNKLSLELYDLIYNRLIKEKQN
jgi:hypothetical protein